MVRRRFARNYKTGGSAAGGSEINLESGLQEQSQTSSNVIQGSAHPYCQVCQKACQHCSSDGKGPDSVPAEDKGKLIKEETADRVKFKVFLAYIRNVGLIKCLAIILMYLIGQIASLGVALWLSDWSDDTTGNVNRSTRVGIHALLAIFQFIFGIGSNLLLAYGHLKGAERFHRNLLSSILHSPATFFDQVPSGRILNRFAGDVNTLDDALRASIAQTLSTGLQVVMSILIACILSPYLIPVIAVVMALFLVIQNVYVSSIKQMKRLESVSKSPLISHLSETISGSDTIRAYGVSSRYEQLNQKNLDANHITMFAILMTNRWLATLLESLCNVLILILSVFAVCFSQRSAGTAGLVISQVIALTQYLNWVVRMTGELESNIVCVERIEEYSRLPSEAPWEVSALKPPIDWPKGEVAFIKYATKYREHLPPVLRNLSFRVQVGQKIGLVGRTGSGKSSLVNALFRLIEATEGQILIDEVDISKLGLHDLRGRLTIIPQDPVLFSSSLRFNLDPFGRYSDTEVWQALQMANLKNHIEQHDGGKGLEMIIDEGGSNLSLGQRQLVCLARALLRRSQILVLDEATSSVDPMTDNLIQDTIRNEFKSATVITIAHRINTVMDYDMILVLDNGSILEFDSPSALLKNPNSQFFLLAKEAGVAGIGEAYDPSKLSSPQSDSGKAS